MAVSYSAVVGISFGGLVWLNACRPRGFNLLSLALMVLMVFMADQGLRWTETGARLTGRSSRSRDSGGTDSTTQVSGTFSSFEALEHTQAWSAYPLQDYPVEPAPRRSGATRLVAFGGSSTGGAWQNDNLDQFWPAELERQRGTSVQAINQGVGGWTTLHIRRFVETRLEDVDPDVVVLYIGHNDLMTESIRPYGELYAAWQRGTDVSITVSGALSNVPLYQLMRFGLQSALGGRIAEAVPIDDAQANLTQIAALLAARDVPVMVVREGVVPDPSVLDGYGDMLASWAAEMDNATFVDAAATLTGPGAGDVFLDDCHLTERGHARVAGAVRSGLLREGWIPPSN
jgi:lysophospholipase L1-like esterase